LEVFGSLEAVLVMAPLDVPVRAPPALGPQRRETGPMLCPFMPPEVGGTAVDSGNAGIVLSLV
jgi:hypothetical protein